MPSDAGQTNQRTDSEAALEFLVDAVKKGRPIVPFLGAGISAGSGFPLTDGLREYLCKVKFFIRYSVYRRLLGDDLPSLSSLSANSLEFSPAQYLVEFGWPDFNRLSADLWRYAERYGEPTLGRYAANPINTPNWLDESLLQQVAVAAALDQATSERLSNTLEKVIESTSPKDLKDQLHRVLRAKPRHPLRDALFATLWDLEPTDFKATLQQRLRATPPMVLRAVVQQFLSEWMPQEFRKTLFDVAQQEKQPSIQLDVLKRDFRKELLSTEYLNRCYTEFASAENDGTDSRFNSFLTCQAGELFQRIRDGRPVWAWERNRLNSIVQFMLLDLLKSEDRSRTELIEKEVWKNQLRLHVDWFKLLHDVVEGRRGLADELLAQLNRDREPSLSHLMLAHLTHRLGWRLILTLNHDTLLEKAYISEGVSHKVFDVNAVSGVPDAALLRREPLSVVKLHGSAFGLRLGESTNDELDESTRERLLQYIPDNAVLLVLGFSGYERRMMSVIESIAASGGDACGRMILWMHWESQNNLPAPVKRLEERLKLVRRAEPILLRRLEDAGAFLKGFYQRITHTLPETRTSYEALPKRVMPNPDKRVSDASNESSSVNADSESHSDRLFQEPVQLFVRDTVLEVGTGQKPDKSRLPSPPFKGLVVPAVEANAYLSTSLSAFVRLCRGYDVIWIDLEEHHTVTGVVTDIITRMRVFDPTLPPLVLPVTDTGAVGGTAAERFGRAARYIQRAIRRGRYILAFDSVEGFGRPQTAHHGLTSVKCEKVKALLEHALKDAGRSLRPATEETRVRHADLRTFEGVLYSTLHSAADTPAQKEYIGLIRTQLPGYRRLIDLLDFFQILLRVDPDHISTEQRESVVSPKLIPPERGTDPLTVDWYCCFAIDVPQSRHHDAKPTDTRLSYADLTFFALQRFCKHLQSELGCRSYNVQSSASRADAGGAQSKFPGVAFPQSPRLRVARIPMPERKDDQRIRSRPLGELNNLLNQTNNAINRKNIAVAVQQRVGDIVAYSLRRFSPMEEKSPGFEQKVILPSEADTDAEVLFFLLSMYRRPRNLASIVALIERLQAMFSHQTDAEQHRHDRLSSDQHNGTRVPFDVDKTLKTLRECDLLHLTEGELYFVSQHVHEVAYKALSSPVRLTTWKGYSSDEWKEFCKSDHGWLRGSQTQKSNREHALLRAAWLGRVHSVIGRHYYVHIWQRSHDPNALFEYLYHRLASLRYLKLLRTRLKLVYDHLPNETAQATSQTTLNGPALGKDTGFLQLKDCLCVSESVEADRIAGRQNGEYLPKDEGLREGLAFLLKTIDFLREEYVNALINVMERERSTVLASAPAETWLNWVQQLRGKDLEETFEGKHGEDIKPFLDAWKEDWTRDDVDVAIPGVTGHTALRDRLNGLFLDLEGSLYRQMSDFTACINSRIALLWQMLPLSVYMDPPTIDASGDVANQAKETVKKLTGIFKRRRLPRVILSIRRTARTVESSLRFSPYGGSAKLIHSIETTIIDIAASARHLVGQDESGREIIDGLLASFTSLAKTIRTRYDWSKSDAARVKRRPMNDALKLPEEKHADNALQVAELRCEFERHRLVVDELTKNRFAGRDFLGRVSEESKSRSAEVLERLPKIHKTERQVYGAPFIQELDFILQVSKFAALRAKLLTRLGTEASLRESLRLLEEAESGLSAHDPTHVFHRVIIHLERTHTMMLLADAAVRRIKVPEDEEGQRYDRYRDDILPSGLVVAQQMLATARAELSQAETILKGSRRNVGIWKRLYIARAQLAIEELLRLTLVVEFHHERLGHEHLFVAEIQEWLLTGLESIRGALDCSVYPETMRRDGKGNNQEPTIAERENYAEAIIRYLQLFVVARLVLRAYGARPLCDSGRHGTVAFRMQSMMRLNGDQRFIDRWEALNDSVGLSRTFNVFDIRAFPELAAQQKATGEDPGTSSPNPSTEALEVPGTSTDLSDSRLLSWLDILNFCDDPTDTPRQSGTSGRAETLRELALLKMDELLEPRPLLGWGDEAGLGKQTGGPERHELRWIIRRYFAQRKWLYQMSDSERGRFGSAGQQATTKPSSAGTPEPATPAVTEPGEQPSIPPAGGVVNGGAASDEKRSTKKGSPSPKKRPPRK